MSGKANAKQGERNKSGERNKGKSGGGTYHVAEKRDYVLRDYGDYGGNAFVACRYRVVRGILAAGDILGTGRSGRSWPCKGQPRIVDPGAGTPGTWAALTCSSPLRGPAPGATSRVPPSSPSLPAQIQPHQHSITQHLSPCSAHLLRRLLLVSPYQQWIILHWQMGGMQGMSVRLTITPVVIGVALATEMRHLIAHNGIINYREGHN